MAQGIETLKKDIQLIVDAIKQSEASFKDGFQLTDLFSFVNVLSQVPGAIDSFKTVVEEAKDLTQDEVKALLDFVSAQLSLTNKKVEQNIKDAIAVIFAVLAFIKGLKAAPVVAPVAAQAKKS